MMSMSHHIQVYTCFNGFYQFLKRSSQWQLIKLGSICLPPVKLSDDVAVRALFEDGPSWCECVAIIADKTFKGFQPLRFGINWLELVRM